MESRSATLRLCSNCIGACSRRRLIAHRSSSKSLRYRRRFWQLPLLEPISAIEKCRLAQQVHAFLPALVNGVREGVEHAVLTKTPSRTRGCFRLDFSLGQIPVDGVFDPTPSTLVRCQRSLGSPPPPGDLWVRHSFTGSFGSHVGDKFSWLSGSS